MRCTYTKFPAMSMPEIAKTQVLRWDSVTSHGTAERKAATVVPSPNRTSNDGRAQQSSVPSELKSAT